MGSGSSVLQQERLIDKDDMLSEERIRVLLKQDFRKDIFDANQEGGFISGSKYLQLLALHGSASDQDVCNVISDNDGNKEADASADTDEITLKELELSKTMLPPNIPVVSDPVLASAHRTALETGRMFIEKSTYMSPPPSRKEVEEQLNRVEGLNLLFACQYRRMYGDPLLYVLFDVSHPDTNVSALEHGARLGTVIADRMLGGQQWRKLNRGSNLFQTLHNTHGRAKGCPMRPKSHRNQGFTINQRNSWLGHNHAASLEMGCSQKFADKLTSHLASLIGFYGPWIADN